MKIRRYEYFIPVGLSIIYFLSRKEMLPEWVYFCLAIIAGIFYFPVRPLMFLTENKDSGVKMRILAFLINFNFSTILFLSVLSLFLPINTSRITYFIILVIVSFISLFYLYVFEKERNFSIINLLFLALLGEISFI